MNCGAADERDHIDSILVSLSFVRCELALYSEDTSRSSNSIGVRWCTQQVCKQHWA